MNKNRNKNNKGIKDEQPRKDNRDKRVNYDNTRVKKFDKDMEAKAYPKDAKPTKGCNDIRWYANNPELLRAAASIPFTYTTGTPLPWADANSAYVGVPGVYTMYWTPYLGNQNPAIIAAANSTYSDVVHANSRNTQYDPNDLIILILAGAQVFSAFALGVRAYGLMRRYDQQDSYTPRALLLGQGFNPDDLRSKMPQMWFDLNQLAAQLQQIWIPNTMPIIERWFWLNSNVYRDGDSAKSQYYQFAPAVFYQYSATSSNTGGSLQPIKWMQLTEDTQHAAPLVPFPSSHTWAEYMSMMQGMISALLDSQDRGIIFGDILKNYGADKLYSVSPINVDYAVEPVYDKEVLSQIENATFFSNAFGYGGVQRTTDIGPIVQLPGKTGLQHQFLKASLAVSNSTGNGQAHGVGRLLPLNFHQKDMPTPEQIMIATRLRAVGTRVLGYQGNGSSRYGFYGPANAGTEVLVWASGCITSGNTSNVQIRQVDFNKIVTARTLNVLTTVDLQWWTAADWAPALIRMAPLELEFPTTDVDPATVQPVYGDVFEVCIEYDNYTILAAEDLEKMHQTAIYGLFGVPALL